MAMATNHEQSRRLLRSLSLDALRGFESAARHLNFTAAANELCVTQSAVSKQVKQLEGVLGKSLFHRSSRGLGLTAEGRLLYEGVEQALDQMSRVLESLAYERRTTLTVSVTPSFASLWLVPKLGKFRAEEPLIDVHLDASENLVQLERDGFDMAIRLAEHTIVQPRWKHLARERMMLVAAPHVAEQIKRPEDISRFSLLVFHDPRARYSWMSWLQWLKKLGLPPMEPRSSFHFSQYEHLVRAAEQGVGIAIGRTPLILPLLAGGSLRVVLPAHVEDGMSYHLVLSDRSQDSAAVTRFAEWIERELVADSIG